MYQYINVLFELFQTYVLDERYKDMLVDGWKWRSAGSCQRPRSEQYFESRYITFMERTALKRTSSVMSSNALIESMYTSLLYVSASVVTTLWRYTNLIILVIIAVFITETRVANM